MIHHLMTCWWSGQRLERYLDRDEAARLSDAEIARLEHHLSVCSKCATSAEDLVRLKATLARLPERSSVDPAAIARLGSVAARLRSGELG